MKSRRLVYGADVDLRRNPRMLINKGHLPRALRGYAPGQVDARLTRLSELLVAPAA
jgi:hypothetical protein